MRCDILDGERHPEGLDVARLRFLAPASFSPESKVGHIASILKGGGVLRAPDALQTPLSAEVGTHLYIPPGLAMTIHGRPGTEMVLVSAASPKQSRGERLMLRREKFIAACATESHSLRWVLTPQYLSRRIFLHHDPVLISRSGNPVSWFKTTMFDVAGLPANEDGEPVFKMSYNSRTEFNVCFEVTGTAHVRMARHPYTAKGQRWDPWQAIDNDTTYLLHETSSLSTRDTASGAMASPSSLRNKHEVRISGGQVSLFCLFDPAPTGLECHKPGEYSDYEPFESVSRCAEYRTRRHELAAFDEMVDTLSLAEASGKLNTDPDSRIHALFASGYAAQTAIETGLHRELEQSGEGRELVIAPWMSNPIPPARRTSRCSYAGAARQTRTETESATA